MARKVQIWWDITPGGALTEFTSEVNSVDFQSAVDILENTHVNEDTRGRISGITEYTIALNGYFNDTSTGAARAIWNHHGSETSCSWQILVGASYYYGEGFWDSGATPTGDGQALLTWAANLMSDGAATRTSVSQA